MARRVGIVGDDGSAGHEDMVCGSGRVGWVSYIGWMLFGYLIL